MEYKETITVVTVCYNCRNEIEKTINSVINQTYQNIEYIIIDGASNDGTLDIVNKYSSKISLIISEADNGVYDAMNKGIKKSCGKWILFMNAGDTFYDDYVVENTFKNYVDNGESIIYGKVAEIDECNNFTGVVRYGYEKCFPACHQAIFTRTTELKDHPFNTKYKIIADYVFYYHLYKRNPSYLKTNSIIANYNNNGLSRNSYRKMTYEYLIFYLSLFNLKFIKFAFRYLKQSIVK